MAWTKAVSRFIAPVGLALLMMGALFISLPGRVDAAGGVTGTLRGNVVDLQTGYQ
jgi:hypothetical protein